MTKNIFIHLLILAAAGMLHGQVQPTASENYLYTRTCLSGDCTKKAETVTYYDGLARPKQNILLNATPQGKDLVGRIEYDSYGREAKSYLPLPQQTSQNGALYPSPDASFYGGEKIYAENKFEEFPKARLTESYPQGTAWAGKPDRYTYGTNAAGEVKMYVAQTSYAGGIPSTTITQTASYPAATLDKATVTDADLNPSTGLKNGKGQRVLVRKNDGVNNTDTYYVYDNYGRLSYVIPPLASATALTTANIDKLCYQYRYDTRGRQIAKKLPGKGWEFMVYDKADRLVLTQDASLTAQGKWLMTKYDPFGRVAYTGILTGGDRASRQNEMNSTVVTESRSTAGFTKNGMTVYYTENAFAASTVLTVNYYDTYPPGSPASPSQILGQDVLPQDPQNSAVNTRSLPVASYIKNVEDDSWTRIYNWYDGKGRNIATHSLNHLGGYTKTETVVDFTGVTQLSVTKHKRLSTDTERIISETFEYDTQNRLLVHKHQVDNHPVEILAQNTYNAISRLVNKKTGGATASGPLQSIDYAYNIRGWMTKINDPKNLNGKLFGYEMKYNQVEGLQTPNLDFPGLKVMPRYNGNIAEVDWRTNTTVGDNLRRYGYVYDGLNRLSAGFYQKDTNPSAKEYFEKIDYDLNGNIIFLKRSADAQQGAAAYKIDDLTYGYSGNRLISVTDSSTDYRGYPDASGNPIAYDEESGNMKSQKDKGILDIKYNYLDLPDYITFDKTYVPRFQTFPGDYNVNTRYLYRADGTKLKKIYTYGVGKANTEESTVTDYLDGFQYETVDSGNLSAAVLKFLPTAEGYYNFENNKYIYSYTDHLGNIRLSYFNNGSGAEVLEENNYYPFGLKHEGYNPTQGNPSYKYQFGSKELQTETGWGDFGARFYMADIGRWGVADPMAEVNPGLTPYRYGFNNPIMFTDPNGMLEQALMDKIWSLGGTWNNTGDGFENDSHIKLGYNGNYLSLNTDMDSPDGGGGGGNSGGGLPTMNIPGIALTGQHNQWGQAFQNAFNSYMNSWNTSNFNNFINSVMNQIQNSTSGNYVRATPSSNSPEVAMGNPSGQLAVAGLYGLQGGTSALTTEYVAAKTGFTFLSMFGKNAGFSWSSLSAMESSPISIFSTSELIPTHAITKSKTQMQTLLNDVAANGVSEPVKYVEFNGQNYIVDGHHRFFSAQRAGISHIPVEQVQLPYGAYRTSQHLMMEGSNPGYWRFMKVK